MASSGSESYKSYINAPHPWLGVGHGRIDIGWADSLTEACVATFDLRIGAEGAGLGSIDMRWRIKT